MSRGEQKFSCVVKSMFVPERLLDLRKKKGDSQRTVAARIGITNAQLGNYERGINEPSANILSRLAEYYCVTTDYLCGLSDNPQGTSERPILDATCEAIIAKLMGAPDDVVREAMDYVEYLTEKAERRMRQERKERDSLKRIADKGDAEKGEP